VNAPIGVNATVARKQRILGRRRRIYRVAIRIPQSKSLNLNGGNLVVEFSPASVIALNIQLQ